MCVCVCVCVCECEGVSVVTFLWSLVISSKFFSTKWSSRLLGDAVAMVSSEPLGLSLAAKHLKYASLKSLSLSSWWDYRERGGEGGERGGGGKEREHDISKQYYGRVCMYVKYI